VVKEQKLKDSIVQIIREEMERHARMEATREPWQVKTQAQTLPSQPGQASDDYSKAPVFIILLGDTRTNVGLPMIRRYNYQQMQLAYISGLAGAMLYMHLAATTLGLGSQWVSAVGNPYVHCLLKNLLGIPMELEIYDMMAVGYPGYKPRPRLVRDREEMVHYGYCGEGAFRTDEAVRDYIVKIRNP
jgi:nitroreductase